MKHQDADVLVIGGGHAGCEAAYAAARAGAKTLLLTLKLSDIGVMSCNPAIGGLGKGHLVREIDAMGGLMGLAADHSGIQFRLLNRRKGPAVRGPRTQSDRVLYRRAVAEILASQGNLRVVEGEAAAFSREGDEIRGVRLANGAEINASAVVLTTGTFLRGTIHIGMQSHAGGRIGDPASHMLADQLREMVSGIGRLKTGTPPRLRKDSIDWNKTELQQADTNPAMFSYLSDRPCVEQIACGITHTNEKTHEIIGNNLARSAMYGGKIQSVGPRYCPSIEDKVTRFQDKASHQIFLEPEGLTSDLVYPNGISTSLPTDVQVSYVRSIAGLENAVIAQPGYAIEYDFVDPQVLDHGLRLKDVRGLFLAGQINGTTGYEEAAAQGLIAGLNAAFAATGRQAISLARNEAYIGVLIDDLITRGVSEPYRMFTSRAEFRLSLRADNADQRLTPKAQELGLITEERRAKFSAKMALLEQGHALLRSSDATPSEIAAHGIDINQDGRRRTAEALLSFPNIVFEKLEPIWPALQVIDPGTRDQLTIEALYAHYIWRQQKDVESLQKDERLVIPDWVIYSEIGGLSAELTIKLERVRPPSIGHAARIDGMTPAALTLILAHLRRGTRESA